MPGTYYHIGIHVVFKTKNRRSNLTDPIADELHAFMAGLLQEAGVDQVHVGGVEDHVHLYFEMLPRQQLSDLMRIAKARSSHWLRRKFSPLSQFAWQEGYAAFSVSKSERMRVIAYVNNQREHHRGE